MDKIGMIGFICLMIGSAGMDNASLGIPALMILAGLFLLVWFFYESGEFRKKGGEEDR